MALPKSTTKFRQIAPRVIDLLMKDFQLADYQAAGFPGNFGVETGGFTQMQELNPTVKGSAGGLGWAQWTGRKTLPKGRRRAFEELLAKRGVPADDFDANYAMIFRELKGPEKGVLPRLRKARTVDEATDIVRQFYERPGVLHSERRREWGRLALDTYRKRSPAKAKTVSPVPIAPQPAAPQALPKVEPTTWWERLIGVKKPTLTLVGKLHPTGDETLYRQQNRLLAAGYTEVGDPDGLWGPDTETAVRKALSEQAPGVEAPTAWPLNDEVLAALAKLERRQVAAARADVTVAELRERGSTPIKAPVQMVTSGGLLSFLGIGGAIKQSGVLDGVTKAADQAGEIMTTVQSAFSVLGTIAAFAFTYWWAILLFAAVWFLIMPGVKWALEIRALVRQGSIRQTSL